MINVPTAAWYAVHNVQCVYICFRATAVIKVPSVSEDEQDSEVNDVSIVRKEVQTTLLSGIDEVKDAVCP